MSLSKTWLVQQAETQNNALARARSEISFASRVVNQDRPLDWEDREHRAGLARCQASSGRGRRKRFTRRGSGLNQKGPVKGTKYDRRKADG